MKIKIPLIILCFTFALCLVGCRDDNSLDDYQEKMVLFYEQLNIYGHELNSLDPNAPDAITDMLYYLDGIALAIKEMVSYDVPEIFYGVRELSEQADEYMTEAVRLYQEAFLGDEYDDNIAQAAHANYERVNLRLRYIAEILRGDIPEEIFSN